MAEGDCDMHNILLSFIFVFFGPCVCCNGEIQDRVLPPVMFWIFYDALVLFAIVLQPVVTGSSIIAAATIGIHEFMHLIV